MKYFEFEIQSNILILYFQAPQTSNAFGIQEAEEFHKITQTHIKNGIQGILLTSNESIFCSGGHLKNYANQSKEDGLKVNKRITHILEEFSQVPVPTLALVQGDCIGGGLEVISAFDKVFATENAFFGMWQRKISLTWGWGGGHRLKKRIAKKLLLNLLLEAKTFSSFDALNMGLIDKIYPQSMIVKRALQYFKQSETLPKAPVLVVKAGDFKHEDKIFKKLWWNSEHKEVLAKFKKKSNKKL